MLHQREIKSMRKEERDMRELEARTVQDVLTANLNKAARVLSLTPKDIKFDVEGDCEVFTLTVKFDHLDEVRYVQFIVTKEQLVWNVTYRIYSYDDFLRERMIKATLVLEIQMFMRLVLKQDLVLETDPTL